MPPGDLAWVSGVAVGSGRLGVSIVRLSFLLIGLDAS
jgi:hypothetical protein